MDIQPLTTLTGKLQPARMAHLRFQLSGQVTKRYIEPGQKVSTNEPLLQIDPGDFVDAVNETQALLSQEEEAIDRDRKLLELIKQERVLQAREVKRLAQLGQKSLASKSLYDSAEQALLRQQAEEARLKFNVDSGPSRLKTKQAILNRAERNLARTQLTAPFNAIVNHVEVEIGDYVTPGQAAIDLVQLNELDLYLEVAGELASSLSLGSKVKVTSGEISKVGNIIALAADPDPNTNTYELRVRLNGDGLFSGANARAELPGRFLNQVNVVPVEAILRDEGKSYVFTVENNRLNKTEVQLMKRYKKLQVIEGISVGMQIVARDVASLADGQEISVY